MKSIFNHKAHMTTKVSILAIILLVSIAMPLLTFTASAAATVSISPSTGPNGTAVKVTGSGFGVSETYTSFTISVDGLNTKATLTGGGLGAAYTLATDATGTLTGYFIIGGAGSLNLAVGVHSVQISDPTTSPPAVTFTVVAPTVTLAPATGPAGTSVIVTASNFPTKVTSGFNTVYSLPGEVVSAASFAGSAITVQSGTVTASPYTLSSNSISSGKYTGTVSLPGITTGVAFTLTDAYGNVATTNFALNTPMVTLTPNSGPVGTLVTATVSGFGPGATFSQVWIGNGATPTSISPLIPAAPMVTEQGTSAFQFVVSKATLTGDFVSGSQMITVKDSLGDVASSAFTITANATVTLGSATVNSGVPFVPAGTTGVVTYLTVNGFKANALLTITSSPGVPAGWITYMPGGYPTVTTDATGSISTAIVSATGTAPPSGVYSMTVSDGTNSVTLLLTITSSGNFFVISPNSGAQGTTVALSGFLTTPGSSGAINFDGFAVTTTACVANTWPTPPTTMGAFTVPASGSGPHTITTANIAGAATFTNTGAPAITMVIPSSAAVGTTVTLIGTGFANNPAQTAFASFTIDSIVVPVAGASFTKGAMVATFVVPVFLPGVHIISATDGYFNTATASVTTTVSSITISPVSGVVAGLATTLQVTGTNFPMNQAISVTFGTTTLAAATVGCSATNTNGQILIYTTAIAASTLTVAGAHTITVTAGTASATATFTVISTISLTATAVKPGGTTSITGAGFAASSALTLTINGTAASWYNTGVSPATVLTTAPTTDTSGNLPANIGTVIANTTAPGAYIIVVTDASGNTAQATLTVLGAPAIFLAAGQGISGVGTVGITGTGFTPSTSRAATVNIWQGGVVVAAGVQTVSPVAINSTGGISASQLEAFTVPALAAGVYTVNLTLTLPTESAVATFTILGAPTVTPSVTAANVGVNVTLTIVGITSVSAATLGGTQANLLATPGTTFGSTTVPTTGASAYSLTTWFVVPSIPGGAYTLLVSDGTRSAVTTFSVNPSITLSPTTGILKGTFVYITGTGFGTSGTSFNVTVNGAIVTLAANTGTTGTGGTISTNFAVPLTATSTNTVKVTDTLGNTATSSFVVTPPTITLTPTSGPVGSTVEIIGNAFTPYSAIVVEFGTTIVNTVPAGAGPNPAGTFLAFVTVPAGLSGNQTITVIDSSNNMATANFTVGGAVGGPIVVDQAGLSASAQTQNSAGQAASSFARGSTLKISFVLDSTSGSGNVVTRLTLQQGSAVFTVVSAPASISSTPAPLSFSELLPTTVSPGTWTASIQIFASDGVTPLGVATLTFSVT